MSDDTVLAEIKCFLEEAQRPNGIYQVIKRQDGCYFTGYSGRNPTWGLLEVAWILTPDQVKVAKQRFAVATDANWVFES